MSRLKSSSIYLGVGPQFSNSGGAWPQFMKAFSLQCNNVRTSATNRSKPKQQSFVRCTFSRSRLGITYRKFSESYFKMSVVQRKNDKGRNLVNFNTVWILTDEKYCQIQFLHLADLKQICTNDLGRMRVKYHLQALFIQL